MVWFNTAFVAACWRVSLLCSVVTSGFVWADAANEASVQVNELHIQPNTCVSLHQGQACFVSLTMTWSAANINNYCLYSSAQAKPLKCWMDSNHGDITQQFSTAQTLHFYLQADKSSTAIAESVLNVSWVYKKQQKSRLTWRLF